MPILPLKEPGQKEEPILTAWFGKGNGCVYNLQCCTNTVKHCSTAGYVYAQLLHRHRIDAGCQEDKDDSHHRAQSFRIFTCVHWHCFEELLVLVHVACCIM